MPDIYQLASNNLQVRYKLVTPVTNTYEIEYGIVATVVKALTIRCEHYRPVNVANALRWQQLGGARTPMEIQFKLFAAVSASLAQSWLVLATVGKQVTSLAHVEGEVVRANTIRYLVIVQVVKSMEIVYKTKVTVNEDMAVGYKTLITVKKALPIKYAVAHSTNVGIPPQPITVWIETQVDAPPPQPRGFYIEISED